MADHLLFVGPGSAGLALGYALWEADAVRSLTYCGRKPEPPDHPLFTQRIARYVHGLEAPGAETTLVVLSVPDRAILEVAESLAALGRPPAECAAVHMAGALTADPLAALHAMGYSVGCLHPLQTIAAPLRAAERLRDCYYAVSGEPLARAAGRRLVLALGGRALAIPATSRPLYHAAAVTASNYLLAVLGRAASLLERAGAPHDEALAAVLPLARGTLENVEEVGLQGALTGPIARGDIETIRLHLRGLDPDEKRTYAALGLEVLDLCQPLIDPDIIRRIQVLLEEVK